MGRIIILVSDDDAFNRQMLPLLKRRLRGSTVLLVNSEVTLTDSALGTYDALVAVVSGKQSKISSDHGIGHILSAVKQSPDSLVFPILLHGAQMPSLSDLPESLHWFALTNALQIDSGNLKKQTIRLAKSIRNKATFSDPISTTQFLTDVLRRAFRPMCWGPLWAFGCVVLTFSAMVCLMFAVPTLQTNQRYAGALGVGLMFSSGLIAGVYCARNLGIPGMVAGAVYGLVSPLMPFLFVLLIILIPFMISRNESTLYPIFSVATIGVPFALAPYFLAMGYAATTTAIGQPILRRKIVWASIIAVFGFACGGLIGKTTTRDEALPLDNVGFGIATVAYIVMAGITIGLLRGICLTLNERPAIVTPSMSPPLLPKKEKVQTVVPPLQLALTVAEKRFVVTYRNVFISYRRSDGGHIAKALYDQFTRRMPGAHIFRDVDAIPYGLDYRKILYDEVVKCDVLVAVIGPRWVRHAESTGNPIWGENDFVQFEIEEAIQNGIPIIVALFDGASIPKSEQLPDSLRDLEKATCIDVSGEEGMENLCHAIARAHRKTDRPVTRIEQIESAVRLGSRNALRWGLVWTALGILCSIAFYLTESVALELGSAAAGLILLPAACGAMTGQQFGSKFAVVALALLVPILACLSGMVILLIAILVRILEVITIDQSAEMRRVHFVMACGIFLGAVIALTVIAGRLIRQRRRRIRVWNGIVYAALGTMAGGLAGAGAGSSELLLALALPGIEAKLDYSLIMTFTIGGITAGMVHGAALAALPATALSRSSESSNS